MEHQALPTGSAFFIELFELQILDSADCYATAHVRFAKCERLKPRFVGLPQRVAKRREGLE